MTSTTVVIGDIGGHLDVLERILLQLGVDSDDALPTGLQVIQVGDLVRAAPHFREANGRILNRMERVLAANGPDTWIQLIGNHECAALGGPAKGDWAVSDSFDDSATASLKAMWSSGRITLAAAVDGVLVTHAGLTRGRWQSLGSPDTAAQAADLLNRDAGRPMKSFSVPGRLVTGRVEPAADTMWAEVNDELLSPWIEHRDLPFAQVHGHASPFNWVQGQWWPETPLAVKNATEANTDLRRSLTLIPGSELPLISVDWTLADQEPERLWPLLALRSDSSIESKADAPSLWRGPGLVFSVSQPGGQHFAQVGGPRARIAAWEGRWAEPGRSFLPTIDRLTVGDRDIPARFQSSDSGEAFSFEVDVSWNDEDEAEAAMQLLAEVLPTRLYELVVSLPALNAESINENRAVRADRAYFDLRATVLDIPVNSLPSTRQRSRPLVPGTRWVRLIMVRNGLIALWHPVGTGWVDDRVPWPHNAVPSRTHEHLHDMRTGHLSEAERQARWIDDLVTHEAYFGETWLSELEFWQDDAFQWLTEDLTLDDVTLLREDLGILSTYLNSMRWTQRAKQRRVKESGLTESNPGCAEKLRASAAELDRGLAEKRMRLTESFGILSTISQRVQEDAANRARETSERLNRLITVFTAVLFVPTMVSGIYGANISGLADGARGSLSELIALMLGLALISYGLLSSITRRWVDCILGVLCGSATVLVFEIPARVLGQPVSVGWALIPAVIFLTAIISLKTPLARRR